MQSETSLLLASKDQCLRLAVSGLPSDGLPRAALRMHLLTTPAEILKPWSQPELKGMAQSTHEPVYQNRPWQLMSCICPGPSFQPHQNRAGGELGLEVIQLAEKSFILLLCMWENSSGLKWLRWQYFFFLLCFILYMLQQYCKSSGYRRNHQG